MHPLHGVCAALAAALFAYLLFALWRVEDF
ncbi:MAG: potassium-transporting ATPase subunit F [Gammaproteobacteria bacterium]|jgi:K+-transporting ATPase KdpF subunit|nr:potassium-transporting ATPase subunit F [Gammaproteobacteria bacterium]MBU0771119.1 potassium-transporting ATPase subunit F [Gammaproteobacteria bacterium]MBU0855860.1 potassium-transporting ATPase subunit F [Gammaproteobacteria bacterium]MBU1849068.1 potassium-transporting ATPase subunit F [Gammaproteobacteria bacterium]